MMIRYFAVLAVLFLGSGCSSYMRGHSVFEPDAMVVRRLERLTPLGSSMADVKAALETRADTVQEFTKEEQLRSSTWGHTAVRGPLVRAIVSSHMVSIACAEIRFAIWRFDERGRLVKIEIERMADCL